MFGFIILFLGSVLLAEVREAEMEFKDFLKEKVKKISQLEKEANLAYWLAATTGKKEHYKDYEEASKKLSEFFSSKEDFKYLKKLKESESIKDPILRRQLEILYNRYLANQIPRKLREKIIELSAEVEKDFSTFRPVIDGKEYTTNQIIEILKTSKDEKLREKAWKAAKKVGPKIVKKLKELVRLRNEAARSLGFKNYYVMALTLSEQKEEEILKIFDELAKLTEEPFKKIKSDIDRRIAKKLGKEPEDLMPWDYEDLFFQEVPMVYEVDLDGFYRGKDILAIARKYYSSIGLEVEDILRRSDLFEKPGKNPHAFCTDIDRNGDVRILANLKDNERWMGTLLHELGHGVYSKYADKTNLPYLLRTEAHAFTTEAVAMFFEKLTKNPWWTAQMLNKPLKEVLKYREAMFRYLQASQLIFARWAQVMMRFERALYSDPEQDLNDLWWKLVEKYQGIKKPAGRDEPDWATKIHIALYPVYYHNYMLGSLLASQFHSYIVEKIYGKEDADGISFASNREIGRFFVEKVFKAGAKYRWNEMIEKATGHPLSARFFVKQFVR